MCLPRVVRTRCRLLPLPLDKQINIPIRMWSGESSISWDNGEISQSYLLSCRSTLVHYISGERFIFSSWRSWNIFPAASHGDILRVTDPKSPIFSCQLNNSRQSQLITDSTHSPCTDCKYLEMFPNLFQDLPPSRNCTISHHPSLSFPVVIYFLLVTVIDQIYSITLEIFVFSLYLRRVSGSLLRTSS